MIIIGRYVAIFATFYAFKLCFKSRTITARELCFIGWGGMIRGAIAYALVMKIPHYDSESCPGNTPDCYSAENFDVIVSTCLIIVFITTLVFGNFMSLVGRVLVPPSKPKLTPVQTAELAENSHS